LDEPKEAKFNSWQICIIADEQVNIIPIISFFVQIILILDPLI